MKKLFFLVIVFCATHSIAQDETLDEMFDDGLSNSRFSVGTNVVMDAGGTINLLVNARVTDNLSLTGGIGFLPFHQSIDLMNLLSEVRPVRDTLLTKGFYYSLGGRISRDTPWPTLKYYYYLNYRSWSYTAQEIYDVRRFKGCFGIGYSWQLKYGISLDANFGVYLGKEKITANSFFEETSNPDYFHGAYLQETGDFRVDFINGFDMGAGINYNF